MSGPSELRASDADGETAVTRLHTALGEGRIDLDEFGARAGAAYAAVTRAELEVLLADLPSRPTEIVGSRTPEDLRSVFGDVRSAGPSAPARAGTVFGDVRIDLRGLRTAADRVELHLSTSPVPRLGGTPLVVVHARTVFGDLRLRSLAPGESPSRWGALMDRLAQRGGPPIPPLPPPPPL